MLFFYLRTERKIRESRPQILFQRLIGKKLFTFRIRRSISFDLTITLQPICFYARIFKGIGNSINIFNLQNARIASRTTPLS